MPPVRDGVSGKSRSVVGNPDHQSPSIFRDIVNPVRNGDPDGVSAEVVIIDRARGRFPTTARVFEIADELAFFAVHADDGQMMALETVAQLSQIFKLKIAAGVGAGRDLFLIDPQGITHVVEQASYGIGRDRNAQCGQLFGDGGGSTARPA